MLFHESMLILENFTCDTMKLEENEGRIVFGTVLNSENMSF
jgi:hypothetical protein